MGNNDFQILYKARVPWIDTAKVITMLLVVMSHCTYYRLITPYGGIDFLYGNVEKSFVFSILSNVTKFIYSFHMPLFMMISGLCLALNDRNKPFVDFFFQKARRLLIPFVLVTTFISVPCKFYGGYFSQSSNIIKDIIFGQYLLLGNSHLWFVVSLFYIFVLFYKFKNVYKGGLYLWLILYMISILGFHLNIHYYELLGLSGFLKHFLFFSIGYYCKSLLLRKPQKSLYLIFSWCFMIFLWKSISYITYVYPSLLMEFINLSLSPVFGIWGSFNMIYTCQNIYSKINVKNTIYVYLQRHSYELYLFSDPFNYVLIPVLYSAFGGLLVSGNLESLCSYCLRFSLTIIFSILIISIVKKVKICIFHW